MSNDTGVRWPPLETVKRADAARKQQNAVAEMREHCARVAEGHHDPEPNGSPCGCNIEIAAAIRVLPLEVE